jgi:hypothetical protein
VVEDIARITEGAYPAHLSISARQFGIAEEVAAIETIAADVVVGALQD